MTAQLPSVTLERTSTRQCVLPRSGFVLGLFADGINPDVIAHSLRYRAAVSCCGQRFRLARKGRLDWASRDFGNVMLPRPRNQQERGSHRSVGRRLGAAGVRVRASGPLWQHLAAPSPCQLAASTVVRERTNVVFVEG